MRRLLGAILLADFVFVVLVGAAFLWLPELSLRGAALLLSTLLSLVGRGGPGRVARRAFAGGGAIVTASAIVSPEGLSAGVWCGLLLMSVSLAVGLHVILVLGVMLVRSEAIERGGGEAGWLSIAPAGGVGLVEG